MERQEIEGALREVAEVLEERKVRARIAVVGGAAMVLAFRTRFTTRDVDAVFYPPEKVREVAAEVGRRRGLPESWLNDSAKIFVPPFKEPDWRPLFSAGAVEVVAADALSMLAMKLRAARPQRDLDDVRALLGSTGISTRAAALGVYDEYFPEDPLPERGLAVLDTALELGPLTPELGR